MLKVKLGPEAQLRDTNNRVVIFLLDSLCRKGLFKNHITHPKEGGAVSYTHLTLPTKA